MKERMGWTDEDVKQMWSAFDKEVWQSVFLTFDGVREKVMGSEKHWWVISQPAD
jgi:hypothetical protein